MIQKLIEAAEYARRFSIGGRVIEIVVDVDGLIVCAREAIDGKLRQSIVILTWREFDSGVANLLLDAVATAEGNLGAAKKVAP